MHESSQVVQHTMYRVASGSDQDGSTYPSHRHGSLARADSSTHHARSNHWSKPWKTPFSSLPFCIRPEQWSLLFYLLFSSLRYPLNTDPFITQHLFQSPSFAPLITSPLQLREYLLVNHDIWYCWVCFPRQSPPSIIPLRSKTLPLYSNRQHE